MTVESNKIFTCVNTNEKCGNAQLAKNIAFSFTINLKTPNSTTEPQEIIGLSTDQSKRVLTAWICANSNNLYIQRSTVNNADGNIMNCRASIDIGIDTKFYVICNSTYGIYQIYKNGLLYDTQYSTELPLYVSGLVNMATSINNKKTFNGTISNIVLLTSNTRTLQSNDLDAVITYMNNN